MTWNSKIKIYQALAFFGGPLILIFNWNLQYLLLSIIVSWVLVHVGISVGMHRGFAHKSFEPKNKFILYALHFLSVINTVGSTITWCGTHRLHHKTSETSEDPHSPVNKSLWTNIKYWFNYWPAHAVPPRLIKDLMKDPTHKFFHRHYFKILNAYIITLLLIDVNLFLYGYLVVTMFSLHWISWITVGAHLFGTKDNKVKDESRNTYTMGLLMWGEGWHNNHHAKPWRYEFGWNKKQPDFGKHFIELIAKPESLKHE